MNRVLLLLTAFLLPAFAPAAHAQTLLDTLEPPPAPITTTRFGSAVAGVPDVNGDGHGDLLVGAYRAGISPNLSGRAYLYSGATGALIHTLAPPAGLPQDFFGEAVAAVPDTDGDGVSDLLVGSSGADQSGVMNNVGRAYLFSGATGALLHTLESPNQQSAGQFGIAVAGVPDVNGDGRGDLLIGSFETANDVFISGRAYVFSGATGAVLGTLTSPNADVQGHFGIAVAGVPDVNGDGRGDLLIGARGEEDNNTDNAGRAYLFSGATGALLHTLESADPTFLGYFGASVSSVPDVDGDGRSDLLVGARYENNETVFDVGRAYLFSSATGNRLATLSSPNSQNDGFFGWSVAGVPDADGDGRGDLLIGAHTEYPDGAPYRSGRAYLFSGATGSLLTTLVSPNEESNGQLGYSVAGIPDANGDARGDLLVGAWLEDRGGFSDSGNVYLFSGATATISAMIEPVGSTVIPASGGSLSYRVTLTNVTAQPQSTEAWIVAVLPNGNEFGPVRGPQTVPLGPTQTLGPITFSEPVPGAAPAGAYSLVLRVGTYPNGVITSDAFAFTKQASSATGPDEAAAGTTGLPEQVALTGGYPNPFAGRTTLGFALPEAGPVRLVVYDVLGREVVRLVDGELEAGHHEAVLNGSSLPAGVYVARLTTGGQVQTQRLTLVR